MNIYFIVYLGFKAKLQKNKNQKKKNDFFHV